MPDIPDSKVHAHPHTKRSPPKKRASIGTTSPYRHFTTSPYAELAVTSNFTFLTGASHPDEYVYRAAELGYGAIAVTDRNSLAGIVRAHVAAKDAGIPFIVGCRLEFGGKATKPQNHEGTKGVTIGEQSKATQQNHENMEDICVLVYPTSRAAYGRLCRLLTLGKRRAKKGECCLTLDDLLEYHDGLLAVILLSEHNHIIRPLPFGRGSVSVDDPGSNASLCFLSQSLRKMRDAFDDDRLSLALTRLYGADDNAHLKFVESLSVEFGIPLVAVNDVYYHEPSRQALQDVLTCVRHHCTLPEAGFRLFSNGERYLKEPQEMARLFADHPEAIVRTMEIAERALGTKAQRHGGTKRGNEGCRDQDGSDDRQRGSKATGFSLDQLRYEYPHETCPAGKSPMEHLIDLTWQGAAERYPQGVPEKVRGQIEHEFALIQQLQYAPYFLTVHDLVKFARSLGILCQGRGAAANSAVCYCLGVTSVDPDRINLLFERFVSLERNEPPDIDIDFEHERREEVIQYIYEKYGRDRAGLTAEVITYRRRSAVRDVGKALGLSLDAVDRIAKRVDHWELNPFADSEAGDVKAQLAALGFDPADVTVRHLIRLVDEIAGFPRHLSQHVGGFVMTEGPLCESVPIENAAMPNRTVIEWDKDDIEALGMLKVDVLGLGMLTCISKAMELINSHEATKPRSHEGRNGRHRGMKVRATNRGTQTRCEGEFRYEEREKQHGNQDISGFDRLAESHAACEAGVSGDEVDAGQRKIRTDGPDEASCGIHPIEHCRGTWTAEPSRLHPVSQDCPRLVDGITNPTSPIRRFGVPAYSPAIERTASRNGSSASGTHSKLGESSITVPSWLRGSVASWLTLASIPAEDPTVYDMMCKADTVGVFQIESRAQMTMLPRLQPRCFYDLVIEVAIVRPGPIIGDMVHPYLRRRNGEEKFSYPTPVIEEVLGKTLGVPLFQEQVMALAIKAAGFTAGEAERLRRAITAWTSKDDIANYPGRFIEGMIRNGYDSQFATWCFERLKGFSQYGFPESHAASFALLVYASAWIKCYYPAAFAAALLNSQPMGFYAPAQIIRDAQDHGVAVLSADVNYSDWDCTLELRGTKALRHSGTKGNVKTSKRQNVKTRANNQHREASHPNPEGESKNRLGDRRVKPAGIGQSCIDPEGVAEMEGGAEATKIEQDPGGVQESSRGLSQAIPPDNRPNIPSTLKGSQNVGKIRPPLNQDISPLSDFKSPISNLKSEISDFKLEISACKPATSNQAHQPALRLGLRVLKGLREADARKLVETVRRQGPFATPFDLWQASGVAASTLRCLALGDAFQSMGLDRQHALWEVQQLHGKPLPLFDQCSSRSEPRSSDCADTQNSIALTQSANPRGLKSAARKEITKLPDYQITRSDRELCDKLPEIPYSHQVAADYRNFGFSLKDHPLSFLRELLAESGVITAAEAKDERKTPFGRRVAVAGLVLFRQRPGTARGVMFMTLEDETGRIDLIVRPGVYEKFRDAAVYSKLAMARGRVERQNGVVHVLATAFESLDYLAAGLPAQSRDFR